MKNNETSELTTTDTPDSIFRLGDRDPYAYYATLQQAGSPAWDAFANAWVVVDYEQCLAAFGKEKIFGNVYASGDPLLTDIKGGAKNITMTQGEEHIRLRRFHQSFFSSKAVQAYRDVHIKPIIDSVIDRISQQGHADLLDDVAAQIVPRIICSLLGVPFDDDEKIQRILELNGYIVDLLANNYQGEERKQRALAASKELNAMLLPYVRARREAPQDDLISRVWQEASEQYGELSEDDAVAICRELYFAGSDTTIHATAHVLYLLLTDESLLTAVQKDRATVLPLFIEEAMRLFAVVQMRHRIVREDTEFFGHNFKKGQWVVLVNAAANRDPRHYACPHAVDLERQPSTDHFTFGRGLRSCVGAPLARAEMTEIVVALLDRFPNLRLDPAQPSPKLAGTLFRTHSPLAVLWDVNAEE